MCCNKIKLLKILNGFRFDNLIRCLTYSNKRFDHILSQICTKTFLILVLDKKIKYISIK